MGYAILLTDNQYSEFFYNGNPKASILKAFERVANNLKNNNLDMRTDFTRSSPWMHDGYIVKAPYSPNMLENNYGVTDLIVLNTVTKDLWFYSGHHIVMKVREEKAKMKSPLSYVCDSQRTRMAQIIRSLYKLGYKINNHEDSSPFLIQENFNLG